MLFRLHELQPKYSIQIVGFKELNIMYDSGKNEAVFPEMIKIKRIKYSSAVTELD